MSNSTDIPGAAAHPGTVTTWDGSTIPGAITGLTAHAWVADSTGLFHTDANLAAEWTTAYSTMLEGHANWLTPLQRMEGNAEAFVENTGLGHLSAARLGQFREDVQREYDAIDAAMRIDAGKYGIDPAAQFNTYTYQKMEQTLQGNEALQELGYQGHGTNDPIATRYRGFTEDFQDTIDNKTLYVGGGLDNGTKALADFFDDYGLTHAPFAVVYHNGQFEQLNQNGDPENKLADAVTGINQMAFTRVYVASDFSKDAASKGDVVLVPDAKAAPALPQAGPGQIVTLDGSVISSTITGLAHAWVADGSGLFHTSANLAAEWSDAYHLMLQGKPLTEMQHWQADAEAVLENTRAIKLSAAKLEQFREDTQREMDAFMGAMRIDQAKLGIPANAPFTTHTYLMAERTVRFDEPLEELSVQGHGLNNPPSARYRGYTQDFQNTTDGQTKYVGPGLDSGEKAIADFYDDVIMSHAPFPTVLHNGKLVQLNQNGNDEDTIDKVVQAADEALFTLNLNGSDFQGPYVAKPPVSPVPAAKKA